MAQGEEEDEPEYGTVEELDPLVTDPVRIYRRMHGVARGIQRRATRLEKAHLERDAQRQALEQANLLLKIEEEAVAAAETALRHLKEDHAELANPGDSVTQYSGGPVAS